MQVSTRSRPKAAGYGYMVHNGVRRFQHAAARRRLVMAIWCITALDGFNTQPPEGGWFTAFAGLNPQQKVSTRSRPKAAGFSMNKCMNFYNSFNTQPPEGGWLLVKVVEYTETPFQHAAARRRLGAFISSLHCLGLVSTRSRPKAAGASLKSLAPSGFAARDLCKIPQNPLNFHQDI